MDGLTQVLSAIERGDTLAADQLLPLTLRQAAEALGIAESTADADWACAKSWLRLELAEYSRLTT